MKSLRFDYSRAIDAQGGVTPEQLRAIYALLAKVRQQWMTSPETSSAGIRAVCELPKQTLLAYRQKRAASPLGQVFRVANSLMDDLDAVVVLGAANCYAGPKALMQACCDPFHNELRRGPRGGKPRMYFAGNDFDNDQVQALLSRIRWGGYGDSVAETRWALVVCDPSGDSPETAAVVAPFLQALRESLANDAEWFARLFIPVSTAASPLMQYAQSLGCRECITLPSELHSSCTVLSAVGLLPTAMLGLDIMKLLQGAFALHEHFETAEPPENMVLQHAALNRLLDIHQHRIRRLFCVNTQSLEAVGWWYQRFAAGTLGKANVSSAVTTMVEARDYPGYLARAISGVPDSAIHRVHVQKSRTDPLPVRQLGFASTCNERGDLAETYLTDMMTAATASAAQAYQLARCPMTELTLPTIDTFWLGQLFQLLMISTLLEASLLGHAPFDQPELQAYQSHLLSRLRES